MKKLNKILPVILACMFVFSGCINDQTSGNPNASNNNSNGSGSNDSSTIGGGTYIPDDSLDGDGVEEWRDNKNVFINEGEFTTDASKVQTEDEEHYQTKNRLHKVNVTESDRPFIVDQTSDYKILIPENASAKLLEGATFFQKYIREATRCMLPIEDEASYTWNENAKWIVFGRTELFQMANLTMPTDDLMASGYYIKSVGDSVFVSVIDDYGWQKAALSLLEHIVGYEMYWGDTVVFEKDGTTLPDMDIIERPDFEYYVAGDIHVGDGGYGMGYVPNIFISPAPGYPWHNTFKYLPPTTYKSEYPEWYSINDGQGGTTQLCYTARGNTAKYDKMVQTVAAKVIECIEANPEKNNITITQEDVNTTCGCSACLKNYEKYDSYAASIIMFTNDVDDIVQAYLQDKADRNNEAKKLFNILFFGYHKSEKPPVTKNADGTYTAIDQNVICNPNVGVFIACISANYTHSFYEEENTDAVENIKGWSACASKIYMWTYDTNFYEYLYPFNTWDSTIETFRFLKERGSVYMFNQGQSNQNSATCFTRLKEYIEAKALFDVNVSWSELADAWFKNYFGPAAGPMRAYFDQLQAHLRWAEVNYPALVTGNIYSNTQHTQIWPKKTLDGYLMLIDQAYEAIASLEETDKEMYEKFKKHILLESIFPRYAKLSLHGGSYTAEEFTATAILFKKDCATLNIKNYRETKTLDSIWVQWGIV